MPLFGSRDGLPPEVRLRAGLPRNERVLAYSRSDDLWLVGTRAAFLVVDGVAGRRIPWEQVEHAGWDREDEVLEVSEIGEWGLPRPVHRFSLPEPGRMLELMRERVTASVVLQRRVAVSGRRGLSVIARRSPVGGPIDWFLEYDEGLDPADPTVHAVASEALALARAELGDVADG